MMLIPDASAGKTNNGPAYFLSPAANTILSPNARLCIEHWCGRVWAWSDMGRRRTRYISL